MDKKQDVSQVRVYRYSELQELAHRSNMGISQLVNYVLNDLLDKAGDEGVIKIEIAAKGKG